MASLNQAPSLADGQHGTSSSPRQFSQLCKPLDVILRESSSFSILDYFIQYMDSIGALHVVQFWLSVKSFKSAEIASNMVHSESLVSSGINHDQYQNQTGSKVNLLTQHPHSKSPTKSQPVERRKQPLTPVKETQDSDINSHTSAGLGTLLSSPNSTSCDSSCLEQGGHCSALFNAGTQQDVAHTAAHVNSLTMTTATECNMTTHNAATTSETRLVDGTARQLSDEGDALELYSTYIALNSTHSVGVPDEIRHRIEVNICPEEGRINRSCFDEAQLFVYHEMENRYYPGFLMSPYMCKFQLEYISSGKLCLLDFLLGENALFYFMEFMEQESATPLIQFWLTAESFRTQLSSPSHQPDIDRDTGDAISIYERYFSLQATEPLSMGDSVRMDIENKICDVRGPRPDSYDTAQKVAFDTMNKTYYHSFLKSSIYLRFLNELVHMLNKADNSITNKSDKSDAPATGTDLAQDLEQPDSVGQDLDDPDHLWRRPPTLFRLGYVDKFGQYFSECDPLPAKTATKPQRDDPSDSRKFSWLGKRKDQEELAMKIARNIVSEVLNSLNTSVR